MCYAYAVSRAKDPERFGKGAVEGVIAPSTGMNAKEGGGLLPTLFFGVPAGSGMAIMLGALIMLGIKPGPMMIVHDLPLVWSLIWAIAISNLLCTGFLLIVGKHMSAIAHIRASVLVPVVLVFALLGTLSRQGSLGEPVGVRRHGRDRLRDAAQSVAAALFHHRPRARSDGGGVLPQGVRAAWPRLPGPADLARDDGRLS